ncbi:hypothetical protein X768_21180 [Mesorhizobium sp. LSJC265A00]|uniref:ATP-binding protein n=1 Tax=Mesorhizobium sp. LSJC265A00 TaxID=1287322 RepID=UPI0003CDD248|nr:ATP-binding protein [Mesorhizobium sp. LSJC265A00]ESX08598.1 hypothetical protein X768_21180 [Mesorhizobium sp. LSJC265A00]
MDSSTITPIQIDDTDFLVATTIERCPRMMMVRELTKNALEAASQAAEGHRQVIFRVVDFGGTPKLAIWNTGPGMDANELYRMCDLAASIRKEKGLDANFGMGAKVASLPSNKLGMIYRSCKSGEVNEVLLCQRDGRYGRLRRQLDSEEFAEVISVTHLAREEEYDLGEDWTELRLLGNKPEQDTARDPYNGDPTLDAQWLATYLYHRFYRLPEGVRVVLQTGTHKLGDGTRVFEPLPRRAAAGAFEKTETVDAPGGIKIHYYYDPPYEKSPSHNRSISGAIQSALSLVGVVYKDELYDVKTGRAWAVNAPLFGIPFGSKHISVHIELPDSASVLPEAYRQFLRYRSGEQDTVQTTHFGDVVAQHRPQWLIDLIRSFAPESTSSDDIRDELQKLLDELRVRRVLPRAGPTGVRLVDTSSGVGTQATREGEGSAGGSKPRTKHVDLNLAPQGAKAADLWKDRERAPDLVLLRSSEEIDEKQLRSRAGRYYENGQLFLNMLYPSIGEMREALEASYAAVADVDGMREAALRQAEKSMMLRVGRAVVFALAKQLNKEWDADAVKHALAPESLSLAADDFYDSLQPARRSMGRLFRPNRQNDETDSTEIEESAFGPV